MNMSKNTSFADRLSAAADAKEAQLVRAARARSAAESPIAVEQRMAQEAVRVARDDRIAEKRATKLATQDREAAALAAVQVAEAAAREAALKAEQEALDAEFAEQTAREVAVKAERQAAARRPLCRPQSSEAKRQIGSSGYGQAPALGIRASPEIECMATEQG
jgi:hypothetical protein